MVWTGTFLPCFQAGEEYTHLVAFPMWATPHVRRADGSPAVSCPRRAVERKQPAFPEAERTLTQSLRKLRWFLL